MPPAGTSAKATSQGCSSRLVNRISVIRHKPCRAKQPLLTDPVASLLPFPPSFPAISRPRTHAPRIFISDCTPPACYLPRMLALVRGCVIPSSNRDRISQPSAQYLPHSARGQSFPQFFLSNALEKGCLEKCAVYDPTSNTSTFLPGMFLGPQDLGFRISVESCAPRPTRPHTRLSSSVRRKLSAARSAHLQAHVLDSLVWPSSASRA